jgi:hypothetical protein
MPPQKIGMVFVTQQKTQLPTIIRTATQPKILMGTVGAGVNTMRTIIHVPATGCSACGH